MTASSGIADCAPGLPAGNLRTARDARAAAVMRLVSIAALAAYVFLAAMVIANTRNGLDSAGSPLGYDFSDFYEAARFAQTGHAAEAYDDQAMFAAEQAAFPGIAAKLPWNYPPTFQLLLLPLAWMPYLPAWILWSAASVGLTALLARRLAPAPLFWPALLSPAAAINLLLGQNGALSAALLGGGLLLPRRPFLAGLLLGAVSYKPHLAILVPLALLAGREWRALAGALASGAGLIALSLMAFGIAPWIAFFGKAGTLAAGQGPTWRIGPSLIARLADLGLPDRYAGLLHGAVAIAVALAVAWVWQRKASLEWRLAALATGALTVTPYLRIYDLTLLIFPILALAAAAPAPRAHEKAMAALLWIAPAAIMFAGLPQIGPPLLLAAMGLVLSRAGRPS